MCIPLGCGTDAAGERGQPQEVSPCLILALLLLFLNFKSAQPWQDHSTSKSGPLTLSKWTWSHITFQFGIGTWFQRCPWSGDALRCVRERGDPAWSSRSGSVARSPPSTSHWSSSHTYLWKRNEVHESRKISAGEWFPKGSQVRVWNMPLASTSCPIWNISEWAAGQKKCNAQDSMMWESQALEPCWLSQVPALPHTSCITWGIIYETGSMKHWPHKTWDGNIWGATGIKQKLVPLLAPKPILLGFILQICSTKDSCCFVFQQIYSTRDSAPQDSIFKLSAHTRSAQIMLALFLLSKGCEQYEGRNKRKRCFVANRHWPGTLHRYVWQC